MPDERTRRGYENRYKEDTTFSEASPRAAMICLADFFEHDDYMKFLVDYEDTFEIVGNMRSDRPNGEFLTYLLAYVQQDRQMSLKEIAALDDKTKKEIGQEVLGYLEQNPVKSSQDPTLTKKQLKQNITKQQLMLWDGWQAHTKLDVLPEPDTDTLENRQYTRQLVTYAMGFTNSMGQTQHNMDVVNAIGIDEFSKASKIIDDTPRFIEQIYGRNDIPLTGSPSMARAGVTFAEKLLHEKFPLVEDKEKLRGKTFREVENDILDSKPLANMGMSSILNGSLSKIKFADKVQAGTQVAEDEIDHKPHYVFAPELMEEALNLSDEVFKDALMLRESVEKSLTTKEQIAEKLQGEWLAYETELAKTDTEELVYPEDENINIRDITRAVKSSGKKGAAKLDPHARDYVNGVFDKAFASLDDPRYQELGLSVYDRIIINGKSVQDRCNEHPNIPRGEREEWMKQLVVTAGMDPDKKMAVLDLNFDKDQKVTGTNLRAITRSGKIHNQPLTGTEKFFQKLRGGKEHAYRDNQLKFGKTQTDEALLLASNMELRGRTKAFIDGIVRTGGQRPVQMERYQQREKEMRRQEYVEFSRKRLEDNLKMARDYAKDVAANPELNRDKNMSDDLRRTLIEGTVQTEVLYANNIAKTMKDPKEAKALLDQTLSDSIEILGCHNIQVNKREIMNLFQKNLKEEQKVDRFEEREAERQRQKQSHEKDRQQNQPVFPA